MVPTINGHSPNLLHENTPLNRYEVLNHSELAVSEKSNAKNYKIKAYVALGIGLVIFAAAITLTAILVPNPITATIASVAVFVFGAGIYKAVVKNKIFIYYRGLESQAESKAQIHEGYAELIKELEANAPNNPQKNWNLEGMALYWERRAIAASKEIDDLDAPIERLQEGINNSQINLNPEDKKKLQNELNKNRCIQHELMEGIYPSAKLNAAFFTYLQRNRHETREPGEFFTIQPISLLDSDAHEAVNRRREEKGRPIIERPYLTPNSNHDIQFSRSEIKKMEIFELSVVIFGLSSQVFEGQKVA